MGHRRYSIRGHAPEPPLLVIVGLIGAGALWRSKLQADNRAQATVPALKRGLISLDDTGPTVR